MNDDERSEKNVEVSTEIISNVSNENEGDEEDDEGNERKIKKTIQLQTDLGAIKNQSGEWRLSSSNSRLY